MTIRSYQPTIERIQAESQAELNPEVPDGYFDDLTDIEATFGQGAFLVSTIQGEVAGYGGLRPDGEIVRMRVAAKFQRQGIATKLLHALVSRGKALGLERVYLHTLKA